MIYFTFLFALALPASCQTWDALAATAERLRAEGRYQEVHAVYQQALEQADSAQRRAIAINGIGSALYQMGDYEGALPQLELAAKLSESVSGKDHIDFANALNNLALVYRRLGRLADAGQAYEKSLAILEKRFGADSPEAATVIFNLANLWGDHGRYEQALDAAERALRIYQQKGKGDADPDAIRVLAGICRLNHRAGREPEAEKCYRRVVKARRESLGLGHPETLRAISSLGTVLRELGRYGQAEPLLLEAAGRAETTFGPSHLETAVMLANLAGVYCNTDRNSLAEPLLIRALEIHARNGDRDASLTFALQSLASVRIAQLRYDEAEALLGKAIARVESVHGAGHPDLGRPLFNLAWVFHQRRQYETAEKLYRRSLELFEKHFDENHLDTAIALNGYAMLLETTKRKKQATKMRDRAQAIAGERRLDYGLGFTVDARSLRR